MLLKKPDILPLISVSFACEGMFGSAKSYYLVKHDYVTKQIIKQVYVKHITCPLWDWNINPVGEI